jgi:hypothetical protein
MTIAVDIAFTRRLLTRLLFGTGMFFLSHSCAHAQPPPPRPISLYVNPAQGLNFGAFFQGVTGGSVIIYANGSRSTTGDIIQANFGFPFSAAIFEIDANPGTLISIMNGSDVALSGSNGGSMTLHIGSADVGSSFVTRAISPARTQVRIGGTLTVGNALTNPSGNYSGTFSVTFIQE